MRAPSGGSRSARAERAERGRRARGGVVPGSIPMIDSTHKPHRRGLGSDGKARETGLRGREDYFRNGSKFFLGFLGCSVFVHIHTPGRNGRNVLRVNPIWPIPFHCLRHTTVSTTSQNTQDLHIPPEFRKWATLCMPGCPPRHDPRVRCRKAFVTYLLTPEMGRSTTAACSRSQRFGLCDQWRLSVDLEIHPPLLR